MQTKEPENRELNITFIIMTRQEYDIEVQKPLYQPLETAV